MRYKKTGFSIFILITGWMLLFGPGCETKPNTGKDNPPSFTVEGRWFSPKQQQNGKKVYDEHCAACHGTFAQGTVENWKQKLPDGSFPPPPLNGSAHTWHHPFQVLIQTINEGGVPYGGKMPAFQDSLSSEEKIAVIAYVQSMWDEETYKRWEKMNAGQ